MKAAGFDGYRMSIAWSRIYPEGEGDEPNAEGVQHYHDVIDALLERGLEPMITLYHWDLPQVCAVYFDCLLLVFCCCYFFCFEMCIYGIPAKLFRSRTAVRSHS